MRVAVIGSGGREHALAWKLSQSSLCDQVICSPGNPGMAQVAHCAPGRTIDDYLKIVEAAGIDLTVAGPEAPLVDGIVDLFRAHGRAIVGPTAAAARLEGSKTYAKQVMHTLGIPTARFRAVTTRGEARRTLDEFGLPVVLKADGLAAGKGVVIARNRAEAEAAIAVLQERLVIEEFLEGEEASFIALCDGRDAVALEATQDHKQIFDYDTGPNTGGMGAYCDGRILTAAQVNEVMDRVVRPVIAHTGFTGFLYAGLMMTADGMKVLEFNCRLGDPETQPLMHRMASDPVEVFDAAAHASLGGARFAWKPDPSVCVVMAAAGYPGASRSGDVITGIPDAEALGAAVFHAGTRQGASGVETTGGRTLGVTASGPDLEQAIANTYAAVRCIQFDGAQIRTDIARKGLKRWTAARTAQ